MKKRILRTALVLCAMVLLECGRNSGPDGNASRLNGKPRGDGAAIAGTVVKIDADGNLLTNIPAKWISAKRTDNNPLEGDEAPLPEGQNLKIHIGDKVFEGPFACFKGGVDDGKWVVLIGQERMLRIDLNGGSAAQTSGVAVGAQVRLVKVGAPF